MSAAAATLLLSRGEVEALLTLDECMAAVEDAYRGLAAGRAVAAGALAVRLRGGTPHRHPRRRTGLSGTPGSPTTTRGPPLAYLATLLQRAVW